MERNADDHDPELPSGVSPRQLEEALKWLEEHRPLRDYEWGLERQNMLHRIRRLKRKLEME